MTKYTHVNKTNGTGGRIRFYSLSFSRKYLFDERTKWVILYTEIGTGKALCTHITYTHMTHTTYITYTHDTHMQ